VNLAVNSHLYVFVSLYNKKVYTEPERGGQPFAEGFSSTVALPLGNLSLLSDGNLYCQAVWNPIASRTQIRVGYRRRDLSAKVGDVSPKHHIAARQF
jgi:hypothetical protein